MLAELDHVAGRRARWQFALSAARAALVPPDSGRVTGSALGAFALAAAIAVHALTPQTGLLAPVAVAGLPALCARVALSAPAATQRTSAAGRISQAVAVAGVIACLALGVRLIAEYPGQTGGGLQRAAAIVTVIGAVLAAYLLLVLRRPGLLGAGPHSGLAGLAAAVATGSVFLLEQPAGGQSDNPVVTMAVAATAIGAPLAAGALTAVVKFAASGLTRRSLRCALGEVLWAALLTGPAMTIVMLLTTSRAAISAEAAEAVFIAEAHRQGAVSVLAWVAHDDLGGAFTVFTALALVSMLIFLVSYAVLWLSHSQSWPGPGAIAINGSVASQR